jgi:hypothetical protein
MRNQRLDTRMDNVACMKWLEGALEYAYARGRMILLAYLEAVMEDVVFEVEWSPRGL